MFHSNIIYLSGMVRHKSLELIDSRVEEKH